MVELTKAEEAFIVSERKRQAAKAEMERHERELSVLRRVGRYSATRYSGGHHPTYGVYDGENLICLCVYRKGAFSLLDYLTTRKTESEARHDTTDIV